MLVRLLVEVTAAPRHKTRIPLTVAWHAKDGDAERVDYGQGSLSLPG